MWQTGDFLFAFIYYIYVTNIEQFTKIRPVVELKEGIKVTNGNGSLEYPYQIEL